MILIAIYRFIYQLLPLLNANTDDKRRLVWGWVPVIRNLNQLVELYRMTMFTFGRFGLVFTIQ